MSRPLKVAWVDAGHFAHATAALGRTFAGPTLTTFRFPVTLYGVSEGGGAAVPCAHKRSHLSEDLMIVEPVDEAGRPVAPDTHAAKVYLTNLYNRALPLIRYGITDGVTILAEPCRCGSAHRCIADIQGRLDDVFIYAGRRIHPHVFRSVLAQHAGVIEYRSDRPTTERESPSDAPARLISTRSADRPPVRSPASA